MPQQKEMEICDQKVAAHERECEHIDATALGVGAAFGYFLDARRPARVIFLTNA